MAEKVPRNRGAVRTMPGAVTFDGLAAVMTVGGGTDKPGWACLDCSGFEAANLMRSCRTVRASRRRFSIPLQESPRSTRRHAVSWLTGNAPCNGRTPKPSRDSARNQGLGCSCGRGGRWTGAGGARRAGEVGSASA